MKELHQQIDSKIVSNARKYIREVITKIKSMNREKLRYVYFLPNRYYCHKNEIYVSFRIELMPLELRIVKMKLHVPLPEANSKATSILVREISSSWDESLTVNGYIPSHSRFIEEVTVEGKAKESEIDITKFQDKWRHDCEENHGIHLQFGDELSLFHHFVKGNSPYLVVTTV
ncbi:hypothetical protein ACQCN2_04875 [Brevibacillus ginsengisoli]|uniref:hypothetical protein n=1 Tax=Brevibacillus ginsengisoli TaxID=363854 RepID=UPI003CEEDE25